MRLRRFLCGRKNRVCRSYLCPNVEINTSFTDTMRSSFTLSYPPATADSDGFVNVRDLPTLFLNEAFDLQVVRVDGNDTVKADNICETRRTNVNNERDSRLNEKNQFCLILKDIPRPGEQTDPPLLKRHWMASLVSNMEQMQSGHRPFCQTEV